ncbi:Sensory/regulatory protein RpfC [Dyella sp. AD56]|nr:Sensory/regulatory protein RpfC [Dyella sp. AD56]
MSAPITDLREQQIRVEQVRLLLGGVKSSLVSSVLMASVLAWFLRGSTSLPILLTWYASVVGCRLVGIGYARHLVSRGITIEQTRRIILHLVILNSLAGAAWGSLVWIALDHAGVAGSILVMASMAGIAGHAMSMLAPVTPVYIGQAIAMQGVVASKLWLLGMVDTPYRGLAFAITLYAVGLIALARNTHQSIRNTIILRFENVELLELLRVESDNAQLARDKAEQANLTKSKFLAAASHDLRQPVHAQGMFLEVLARSELSDSQRKVLDNARATSQASAEMLNTLLDFSRIDAGVIKPNMRSFRLQPLFNKLETELGQHADFKDIVYRSRETHLAIFSDPALLELMLRNLVSNAIRYTERGGILVACRKRGGEVVIEVFDTGIGIAPHLQKEVFREFHQLGNPERDRRKGLGLGLAITEGLARSMGHAVTLASRPDRGSVFRVSVPLAQGAFSEDSFDLPIRLPLQPEAYMAGRRILVIDDDEAVRLGMLQLLRSWGCHCFVAQSYDEALQLARSHGPELVISDYRLRERQTGAEIIAALRAELGSGLPALIVTGDTAPQRLREATSSGIPLVHKPVSPVQLYHAMVSILMIKEVEPVIGREEETLQPG